MKKAILTFVCSVSFFMASQAQIVITEIMYNPPESGTDSLEFIELYNNSNNPVNMENWSLFGVNFTFPAITLAPNQYLVTAVNAAALQNQLGVSALQWEGGGLNNNGETIRLLDANANVVDEVTYSSSAPWPTGAAGNGPSIVLCDPNSDNSIATNWQAATTPTGVIINGNQIFANPGAPSNCATVLKVNPDNFTALQYQTTNLNVLANDAIPNPANITVSITQAPSSGTATINPNNSIAYTPNLDFCGNDVFRYRVCDGSACDSALVSLKIPCYPNYTIEQVTTENANGVADSAGVFCELTGIVYGVNTRASVTGSQFTIIDGTNSAGINVFSAAGTLGYTVKEGDQIRVRGFIEQFNGLTEIIPQQITLLSSNNTLSPPLVVTVHTEDTESRLIKILNLRLVDAVQWATGQGTGFSAQAVSDDNPLDTITVRIDNDVELFNQPVPPQPFDLTGIGGQFDPTAPYTSGYQIAPRYNNDVSTLVTTKEADFSRNVQLMPNPVGNRLLVVTDVPFERVRIFSATGSMALNVENPSIRQEIQVSHLPNGVYMIQFEKDNSVWTTRFVKQ
ncbi:MAG: lamin tail domain-containing protein [Saprospiraceae bacterium]|nr:lamin tail domain-containing protein [Saprospiraceae bacterium]